MQAPPPAPWQTCGRRYTLLLRNSIGTRSIGRPGGFMKLLPRSRWTMAPSRRSLPELSTGLVSPSATRNMTSAAISDPPAVDVVSQTGLLPRSGSTVP